MNEPMKTGLPEQGEPWEKLVKPKEGAAPPNFTPLEKLPPKTLLIIDEAEGVEHVDLSKLSQFADMKVITIEHEYRGPPLPPLIVEVIEPPVIAIHKQVEEMMQREPQNVFDAVEPVAGRVVEVSAEVLRGLPFPLEPYIWEERNKGGWGVAGLNKLLGDVVRIATGEDEEDVQPDVVVE